MLLCTLHISTNLSLSMFTRSKQHHKKKSLRSTLHIGTAGYRYEYALQAIIAPVLTTESVELRTNSHDLVCWILLHFLPQTQSPVVAFGVISPTHLSLALPNPISANVTLSIQRSITMCYFYWFVLLLSWHNPAIIRWHIWLAGSRRTSYHSATLWITAGDILRKRWQT